MAEAGRVTVVVDTDLKKMRRGLNTAKKEIKSFGSIAQTAIGFTVAGAFAKASSAAIQFGKDSYMAAVRFESTFKAFTIIAGQGSNDLMRQLEEASRHTVSQLDLVVNANKAMLLGIDKEALPEMMEIARAAAIAMGTDVNYMFESIAVGIGRQSRMILDNLGIIVSVEEANKNYAKQLGITASELTDVQKKQAFLNEAMEQGREKFKNLIDITDLASESVGELETAWADFKLISGELISPVVTAAVETLTDKLREMKMELQLAKGEYGAKGQVAAAAMRILPAPLKGFKGPIMEWLKETGILGDKLEDLGENVKDLKDSVESNTDSTDKNTEGYEGIDWQGSRGTSRFAFEREQKGQFERGERIFIQKVETH